MITFKLLGKKSQSCRCKLFYDYLYFFLQLDSSFYFKQVLLSLQANCNFKDKTNRKTCLDPLVDSPRQFTFAGAHASLAGDVVLRRRRWTRDAYVCLLRLTLDACDITTETRDAVTTYNYR